MRQMFYRLPLDHPRPAPQSERDLELDLAVEYLVAGRAENFGESEEEALLTIVGQGPKRASYGMILEHSICQTVLKRPAGLRRRAETAWGWPYPSVLETGRFVRGER